MSNIIEINELSYAYPSLNADDEVNWVLDGINLSVEEGEFLSIMGPTGVGKTTLCLAMNGIVPQSTGGRIKGDVLVSGFNTKRKPVAELAQHVGIVFQDPETQLFNMSVEAEVAFGLESIGMPQNEMTERIDWALSVVDMSDFKFRSPFQMSGGQKQRIAIASILAMSPRILVLDEPTASLDPSGKTEVFKIVRELRQKEGITIVMVSHESERIAEFSDRIVILNQGKVEMTGSPNEVFSQIDRVYDLGLSVPHVTELSREFNRRHNTDMMFSKRGEIYEALKKPNELFTKVTKDG